MNTVPYLFADEIGAHCLAGIGRPADKRASHVLPRFTLGAAREADLARYDERGVIIPAPLQGSAAVLSGKRYGDKHRGPAVSEAYELSHCWIDLAEHSGRWPCPDDLPAGMVELARSIPEDQRADWLRRQANLEDVDRRISYAIRSGDLPIWVAPVGEPERLVAIGALATIDQRSIKGGVYCPLSEEYKSEDDRPWLWERPLFVKWGDWVRFVAAVQSEKSAKATESSSEHRTEKAGANDEDLSDAGWLKGLPAGWIDGFICARRLSRRLKAEYGDSDPAPWHEVIKADYWGPHFGDTPEDYASKQKFSVRIVATMQRALLSGQLAASWFDGSDFRSIPAPAAQNTSALHNALLHGTFEIDPLWSDEWQHWNGQGWAIRKEQFEAWFTSPDAVDPSGLPPQILKQLEPDEFAITSRRPSTSEHVPLSEAVSWIAFGIALNSDRLDQALRWRRLCGGDLDTAQHRLQDAAATLLEAGSSGRVSFFGRHIDSVDDKGKRTEKIDVLALVDYRQVLITGHDHLHYGEGLSRWYKAPNDSHLRGSDRRDLYATVKVSRSELMRCFPEKLDSMQALTVPLPALLPGIGAVLGLEEAVCWLAYDRPSHDMAVYADGDGNLVFRDPDGVEVPNVLEGEIPAHLVAFIGANKTIWAALQDGTLRGLVVPAEGAALSIPRVYWTSLNPECLEYLYHGTASSDAGRGCPVLLSRQSFDDWRATIAVPSPVPVDRAPSVKVGHPPSDGEILAKADEMKARGLDGRTIASTMRSEPGFENVATTLVRELIKGRWKPAGRPKKAA